MRLQRADGEICRLLVEHAPQGMLLIQDGQIVFANPAFCHMAGRGVEEIVGASVQEIGGLMQAGEGEPTVDLAGECSPDATSTAGRAVRVLDDEGKARWMQASASGIVVDGRPAIQWTFIDITERKLAEEELQRSEERERARAADLQAIMDAVPATVLIAHDRECRLVTGNRAAYALLRAPSGSNVSVTPGEVRSSAAVRQILEAGGPYDPRRLPLQRAASDGIAVRDVDQEIVFEDGSRRYLLGNAAPLRDQQGAVRGAVGSFVDITERRRAEEALRESEEKFRTLVECIDDSVFTIDLQQRHTAHYGRSMHRRGFTSIRFLGRTLRESIPDSEYLAVHEAANARALAGEQVTYEWKLRLPAGDERWMQTSMSPIRGADGTVTGAVGVGRDITELKEAEEAIQLRNRDLALLNRVAQTLTSTLDLDQVLTIVLDEAREALGATRTLIWLVDPATGDLVCRQVCVEGRSSMPGWHVKPGRGMVGWVLQRGESLLVSDRLADSRRLPELDPAVPPIARAVLSVPLKVKDQCIGVLEATHVEVNGFTPADQALLEALGTLAATSVANARLYEQARHDAGARSVLLQEINHRVKNNLSAIIGLLYTERSHAGMQGQTACESILTDVIGRVQTMATTHDLLSRAGWTPLPLAELAQRVISSALRMLPADRHIQVEITAEPVTIAPAQAQNLALVINELATNSAKHATIGRAVTHISVAISTEGATVQLTFRDDGPGFPETALRQEQPSVGFELIHNIIGQTMGGHVALFNEGGAVTVIRFARAD